MLLLRDGRLRLTIHASGRLVKRRLGGRSPHYDRIARYDLGPLEDHAGRWRRWRADVVWSHSGAGGSFVLSCDGRTLVDDRGPNCLNDLRGGPYWKLGGYVCARGADADGRFAFHPRLYANLACRAGAPAAVTRQAPGSARQALSL
jgi:hypothetical protein